MTQAPARTGRGKMRGGGRAAVLACGAAVLAGATDVYALSHGHELFVSFMSGNTTYMGRALGQGDLRRAGLIAFVAACFVGGVAAGTMIAERIPRRRAACVIGFAACLLALGGLAPALQFVLIVVALAALNAAVTHVGITRVSLTFVTGTLVRIGEDLGLALSGRGGEREWLPQVMLWGGFLLGTAASAVLQPWLDPYGTWPFAEYGLLLAGVAWVVE